MTTEDRTSKRRRRRRKRPGSPTGSEAPAAQNESSPRPDDGNGGGNRRRRRSRSRRRGPGAAGSGEAGTETGSAPLTGEAQPVEGVLHIKPNGVGVLVKSSANYLMETGDPIVPRAMIEKNRLQPGVHISGPGRRGGNALELTSIEQIEQMPLEQYQESRQAFADLISIDPDEQFKLETDSHRLTTRVLDLLAPIGKGQRCLVVAPPKAGKTTLLKDIAHGMTTNNPEVVLMVLLVDERPEEVTDMRRNVRGEVIASSSDESAESHIQISEIVIERARRLVEIGKDVVILCDSITRMSRAYNNEQKGSGKIMSGGIDSRTMEKPRRFFGAARNAEDWGSLTIIATALIDTGSRMDEVIFQEFKGTGNTEIVLDRGLFERRIFPAMNIAQTGTRKEEKLLDPSTLAKVHTLRRALAGTDPINAMKMLLDKLQKFPDNETFLKSF